MRTSAVIVKENIGSLLGSKSIILHLYLQFNDLTDGELSVCGAQVGSLD